MSYFIPINAQGIQRFSQGGTGAGWYQLNMAGRQLTALPGITVPQGTTGVLIQAISALEYCSSPADALGGASSGLSLPAGGTMFIPGYDAVRQLSFLLSSGGDFVLQFYTGQTGPIPTNY